MKILVVGETFQDKFVYCNCSRLCPEAPVPVAIPVREEVNMGGAANVVENLKTLGENLDISFITNDKIVFKTRILDEMSGQLIVRIDRNDEVSPLNFFEHFGNIAWKDYSAVVISDYGKGLLSENLINEIVNVAKMWDIPTFLDTKFILGDWSSNINYIKLNEKEFGNQRSFCVPYFKNLIVTYGKRGAEIYPEGGPEWVKVESPKVEVSNVSGAGDTHFAALVVAISEGKDLKDAVIWANKAASVAVTKRGVVAVKREEIV